MHKLNEITFQELKKVASFPDISVTLVTKT